MARIMASNNVLCLCHHLQTRVVAGGGLEAGGPDPHPHCVPPQGSLMLFQTLLPNSPQTLSSSKSLAPRAPRPADVP